MHNLRTVFIFEVGRTIKRPAFWLTALLMPVFFGVIFIINASSSKNADNISKKNKEEKFSFVVHDESGYIAKDTLKQFGGSSISNDNTGVAMVKNGQTDAFFIYPKHPGQEAIKAYGKDIGIIKNGRYSSMATSLLQESISSKLGSNEEASLLAAAPKVTGVTYKDGKQVKGAERMIAPGIFLVLYMLAVFTLVGQMLTSTTEEKENRVTEIILTTIKAKTLIIGKILSIVALGLIQMLVVTIPAAVIYFVLNGAIHVNLSSIPIDPFAITIGAILFVSSFILFTGLAVAIGAAMPSAKEASSFIGVFYILMFAPGWAAGTIISDPTQPIVTVMTYFPFTAPTTLMLRNTIGNLTTHEAVIGTTIVAVTGILAMATAVRLFRFGTVEYSRRLSLKEVFARKS